MSILTILATKVHEAESFWTFVAKIVKIDHVVLHNFGSFPPKALWVRFVGHRCIYKFCGKFYGLSGHIKRFSRKFQLHGLFLAKIVKIDHVVLHNFGSFPPMAV